MGTSKQEDFYLEFDSVKYDGPITTFWYMYVDKNGEVNEVKCSIDCKKGAIAFIEHWESRPALPLVKLYPRLNWIKFPPGSAWDRFHKSLCAVAEYRILHTKEYDSYGNIISKFLPTKPERMGIIPESIGEKPSNFVCQKVGMDEEQQNESRRYEEEVTEEKLVWAKKGEKVEKSGIFTVQVGAFRNASYAQDLAARLQGKGYKVFITSLEKKDGILFKVRVGKFTNRQEADNLSGEIKKIEGLQTFITLF